MKGLQQPYILIDMDCTQLSIGDEDCKCDYVFISDHDSWVIPLELTSGKLSASKVLRQLRAGSQFAEKLIPKAISVTFLPIAVVGGKIPSRELRTLRKSGNEVRFGDKRANVIVMKCRQALVEALKKK